VESGVGTFTSVELILTTSGVSFESPGVYGFSVLEWIASMPAPSSTIASGPGTTENYFNVSFGATVDTP